MRGIQARQFNPLNLWETAVYNMAVGIKHVVVCYRMVGLGQSCRVRDSVDTKKVCVRLCVCLCICVCVRLCEDGTALLGRL